MMLGKSEEVGAQIDAFFEELKRNFEATIDQMR